MFRSLFLALTLWTVGAAHAGDRGVTPTEIRLGASAVLSGPLGPQTLDYGVGARLYFDAINAQGGIHGRKIVYKLLDDGFDPKRAVENTRKLIDEDGIFMVFNNTGTAHTMAIMPLAEETRTVVFGPVTGSSALRNKVSAHLFHARAGYADEARRIVAHLKDTGITQTALVFQDDSLGNALRGELQGAAKAAQINFAAEIRIDPKAAGDLDAAAMATEKAKPQAVLLALGGATFPGYIKAVQRTGARPTYYGFSIASVDLIRRELKEDARGIIVAQVMPPVRNKTIPVVAEYHKLLQDKDPKAVPNAFQLEGFIHARILVEGLKRAGRNLTTASFNKAMEELGEISFGRFAARYSASSHNGSAYVELAIIDGQGNLMY